jgi:preprotein translocase subunit SecG
MTTLVVVLHFIAAIVIIGLVLIQQGKGAAMGASFGSGASSTVFGSEGSGNFFTKSTWTIATLFFCTSFGLAMIARNDAKIAVEGPVIEQVIPVPSTPVTSGDVPAVQPEATPATASDVPVTAPAETKE